jgi:hypothetical protein
MILPGTARRVDLDSINYAAAHYAKAVALGWNLGYSRVMVAVKDRVAQAYMSMQGGLIGVNFSHGPPATLPIFILSTGTSTPSGVSVIRTGFSGMYLLKGYSASLQDNRPMSHPH